METFWNCTQIKTSGICSQSLCSKWRKAKVLMCACTRVRATFKTAVSDINVMCAFLQDILTSCIFTYNLLHLSPPYFCFNFHIKINLTNWLKWKLLLCPLTFIYFQFAKETLYYCLQSLMYTIRTQRLWL